jgi:PAS domain S-box-containing protein
MHRAASYLRHPLVLRYGVAVGSSALAFGLDRWLLPIWVPMLTPPFLAAVLISAWYGGRGPMLCATVLSTLGLVYLLPPTGQLVLASNRDLYRLGLFVCITLMCGALMATMREALQRAARARRTAEALAELVRQGASAPDPESVIRLITQRACGLLRADFAAIAVLEPDGTARWRGPWGTRTTGWNTGRPHLRDGVGIAGRALAAQRPVVIERLGETAGQQGEGYRRSLAEGGRTVLATPLFGRTDALGVLLLGWRTDVRLTPDQVGLAETLASHAATILDNAHTRAALAGSEARLRTMYGAVACGVLVRDASGAIIHANDAAQEVIGLSFAAMSGRPPEALWTVIREDGTPLPDAERPGRVVLRTGHPVRRATIGVRRPDGEQRWLLVDSVPVRAADGRLAQVVSSFLDITEQRRLEDELRQAQKMEALGRLAGGIAHDFNNLLTVVIGRSDLLRAQVSPDDRMYASLEQICQVSTRAAALVNQLLAFSRRQPRRPHVLEINEIVQETAMLLRPLVGELVELKTRLDPARGRVRVDAGQLQQVIMNLVLNARDAMPQGGQITLATENVAIASQDAGRPAAVPPGAYVRLSVEDTGCGMDAETQRRLFEPFFTTKEPGKGTGLGLSVVYGIVQQSGGYLHVQSQPGQGTVMRVYLPRVERAAGALQLAAPTKVGSPGTGVILLAEDESSVRALARQVLETSGYTVLAARDGSEALSLSAQHAGPIQLLLTDVVMPGMSGPELARHLVGRRPGMPVLYMSGYAPEALGEPGALAADSALLAKPFTAAALIDGVRRALQAGPAPAAPNGTPRDPALSRETGSLTR